MSSSVRSSKSQAKIAEESVPKTVKFQPFIKEEALVNIHNDVFPSTAEQFFDLLLNDDSNFINEYRSVRKDTNLTVIETVQQAHDVPFGSYFEASQASLEWLMKKRKAFDRRGDMVVAAWAEQQQQQHEMNLRVHRLSRSKAETEDGDIHKEYVEETNRQAIMIAAAKLIANDIVPEDYLGPEIVSHFVMHGTSVAEIVKHLIAVLKKKNDDVSNIFLEALKRAYHWHMMVVSESNDGSLTGKSFQECKDLAARLSGTFVGAARNKHRSDILKIVKDGIEYAFVDAPK
ncbi:unnamed protein product [Camellia sinensis]